MKTNVPRTFLFAIVLGLLPALETSADYRTFTGTGNNVSNPSWGAAGSQFIRNGSVHYGDGMNSASGADRPNPRDISNAIGYQGFGMPDSARRSDFVWQWGQFLDHDITRTPGGNEFFPIMVNDGNDPLSPMIPMMRSAFDPTTGTSTSNPRQQINANTSFIDASMVYGSGDVRAAALREGSGGRMTMSSGNLLIRNTQLLPNANDGQEPDETLFLAGDLRANEQLGLTSMHTLMVREHNRLADQVAAANPNWDDEQIYQHTRKLVGGMVQHITYSEYLPALLGTSPSISGANYDPSVNPSISNEFATSLYRLGHTQVSPMLQRVDDSGAIAPGGPVDLTDAFFVPSMITGSEEIAFILKGLSTQIQQDTDYRMIDTLRNAMFGSPGQGGLDLLSLNIQRSRDHGLPSFVELQSELGLTPAASFSDLTSDTEVVAALELLYDSVLDIDLWVGGLVEDDVPGSTVGALMQHVILDQFDRLMVGDRFFYKWDEELTTEDLMLIESTTLSDLIMRNTELTSLPENVFFTTVPEPQMGAVLALLLLPVVRRFTAWQRVAIRRA